MSSDIKEKNFRYTHTHWLGSPSLSYIYVMQYIARAQEIAKEIGCDDVHFWEVSENGKTGVRFGSDDFIQKTRLQLIMFGDAPNPENHNHVQTINESQEYQDRWVKAAKEFLAERSIHFAYSNLGNNEHLFSFDRPSHAAFFNLAVMTNAIAGLTEDIAHPTEGPSRPKKTGPDLKALLPRPKEWVN